MRRITFLLSFTCLIFPQILFAQNCKKIGVVASWPPLTVFDSTGATGLDVEVVQAIFEKAGLCYKFVRLPSSARTFEEMGKGVIDVSTMTSFTIERQKYGVFSESYRDEKMRLISMSKPRPIQNLKALLRKDHTIGLSIGSYYGKELKKLLEHQKFKEQFVSLASANSRISMLIKNRVDFIIDDIISAHYYKNELGHDIIKVWPYIVHDNPVHLLLSHKSFTSCEVKIINKAINELQPKIDAIMMSYLVNN
ncbi:substrate-binding periplasmic protein [Pseudoalteromonas sp. SS15]|uniref:substrate-binding periplasmic protein n=1 Tax=Pseudoalteromonas sp. SS15 TaxID=3139393 RepID=UPI003BAB0EAA